MRLRITLGVGLLALLAGCGSVSDYYRLEEWGEGWKLEVREKGKQFEARWIEGKNRSVRLTNLDDRNSKVTIINTLYLELGVDGGVINGRLKRVVTANLDRRAYEESHAQWFKVEAGQCVLDGTLNGRVDVKCEGGYTFSGTVRPAKNVQKIEHEKKKP
ncbi:MAG: hypothetical protein IT462_04130 [Planctomycetes bacterium]|nr:hypothetical protein [Planctomycetota bacterium]